VKDETTTDGIPTFNLFFDRTAPETEFLDLYFTESTSDNSEIRIITNVKILSKE